MPEIHTICSYENLKVIAQTGMNREEIFNVPIASFFEKDGQLYYLSAPHDEKIKTSDEKIKASPEPMGIYTVCDNLIYPIEVVCVVSRNLERMVGRRLIVKGIKQGEKDIIEEVVDTLTKHLADAKDKAKDN